MKEKMCQQFRADNDINGNPQRVWAVYDKNGYLLGVINEGFGGKPGICHDLIALPSVEVSVKEYREWLDTFNGVEYWEK